MFLFPAENEPETDHLDQMTAVQLKALCKEHKLKTSGKKSELQDRLRQHLLAVPEPEPIVDDFDSMSDEDLRNALGARELDTSGDRPELLDRLRKDVEFAQQLSLASSPDDANGYKSISEALEAAAQNGGATMEILADIKLKTEQAPKYVDVTIHSLGMVPEKFTVGGAPSVTSDVLRNLAGDPFSDPPTYGSVSQCL